jgi:predicted dehydrogenase
MGGGVVSLRLAVLGHGSIAEVHVAAARACGLDVRAVAGRDAARAGAFASRHGIPAATADWRQAAEAGDVDAVIIATPNALHHPQAMVALSSGKHVLVDKPMAVTVAEGRDMARAASSAERTLLVGHMWRYRDEVIALREQLARGLVGRVVRTRGYGIHAGWGPSGWFTDPVMAGGGALIDMGIHAIDTARFLLGDPTPRRVVASVGRAHGSYEVDDDGIVLIDWDDGVRSVVESGWWQPRLDGVEADTEVYGTKGYARIWPALPAAEPAPGSDVHCSSPMFVAQMADFARCCTTGETPRASAAVGLAALSIVEAAYASAAELAPSDDGAPAG